ncbi:MAG: hemolysin family protein [Anaerolineae bacterium]|nr:hemolysin family protein [Anaerolineae bacterium]
MGTVILGIISVFVLVFINGFFVASEFALVGARRTRITQLANEGHAGAKAAENAINHLDSYIAATQLGITLASLGLGWIGEPAIAGLIEPIFEATLPHDMVETLGTAIAVAIAFSIVTILHIVLGELVPKSIALQRPEGTSVIIARPTSYFLALFRPIIWLMNTIGNRIVRMLGFQPAEGHVQVHSAEELQMLVRSSREAGILQESAEQLLRRAFDFSDLHVREIMQPRVEVEAMSTDITLTELMQQVKNGHHSRYPVYDDDLDHVLGVLHIKDFLDVLIATPTLVTNDKPSFDIKTLMRETLYVPTTLSVDRLLDRMQKTKIHLAIVIGEFGGMAGVVTIEDIMEELIGEIQDEFDMETMPIIEKDGKILMDGLVSLSEASERFGEVDDDTDSATVGGYILEQLGRIAVVGDSVPFGDYTFHVREMDGMRVTLIEVSKEGESDDSMRHP